MANVTCFSLGKKKNQQCQTGEAATSVEHAKGPFTTPRKCSVMASSSTKAAFSAVSTAAKWTHPTFHLLLPTTLEVKEVESRTGHDRGGVGLLCPRVSNGTGVDICLTGGLSLSSHWVVVSAGRVGGWSVLLNLFSNVTEDDLRWRVGPQNTSLCIASQRRPFSSLGVGSKQVPSALGFPFSNSSLQKCHTNYRQNSLYADTEMRLWSPRC